MSSISRLPLLNDHDIEAAQLGLSNLVQAAAAFREGKLPSGPSPALPPLVSPVKLSGIVIE